MQLKNRDPIFNSINYLIYLIHIFWAMSKKKQLFKIIVLGDSGVGKTSLMNQYVNQKFTQNYRATVGADFMAKQLIVDERNITLQIWDTAGQQRFQSLGGTFYKGADCCVIVYDITSAQSFKNIQIWKKQFYNQGAIKNIDKFPIVIIGNKCDRNQQRQITYQQGQLLQKQAKNIFHYETSAKDSTGVEKAFQSIARAALTNQQDQAIFQPQTIQLSKKGPSKKNKKCCG